MPALSIDLLQAGLALKVSQIKLATRSYLRDRTDQATGTIASYAVAAGLFAAAGIFLIAACLVGAMALFRWIEINYGLFPAFGAIGTLLLVIAAICAAAGARKVNRKPPHFPSLTSRLRVAIKANPVLPGQIDDARDTARSAASVQTSHASGKRRRDGSQRGNQGVRTGLIVMVSLLGWAAARRRQQVRRTAM